MKKRVPGWIGRESRIAAWAARLWGWIVCAWGHVVRFWQWARPLVAEHGVALSVVPLILGLVLAGVFWDWLTITEPGTDPASESGSTTVRNLGIVLAALVALPLAIWRGQSADRQAKANQQQADVALRQAETAQEDLRNKRYEESAEMLGSEVLAVRLGGIYALQRLAEDHPREYHVEVMKLLCAFVRNPTRDSELDHSARAERETEPPESDPQPRHRLREDVQVALNTIAACHGRQLSIEAAGKFWLDLHQADLKGAMLFDKNLAAPPWPKVKLPSTTDLVADQRGTDFYGAQLHDANLNRAQLVRAHFSRAELLRAHLVGADLSGAIFWHADLSRATFWSADLTDADFRWAILSGADFSGEGQSPATGLTQAQLDSAVTDATHPPRLYGMVDPHTGEPLRPPERWLDVKPQPKSDDASND